MFLLFLQGPPSSDFNALGSQVESLYCRHCTLPKRGYVGQCGADDLFWGPGWTLGLLAAFRVCISGIPCPLAGVGHITSNAK